MDKKIGIDIYFALHSPRGMGNYIINFLKYLAELDKETHYILYGDTEDVNNVLPKQDNFEYKILPSNGLFYYEQFVLPKQCKKDGIYALHSPGNTSPVFLDRKIKRIMTLHDVIFLKKQIPFSKNKKQVLGRLYYAFTTLINAKKADLIIAPTEFSKQDIIKELHIKPEKIFVDTRGTEHFDVSSVTTFEELKKEYNIPDNYFFHVGGDAPTKNTDTLLEVFSQKPNINIVVAGVKKLETSHLYQRFKQYQNITFVPYISQADIVGLYKNSQAFIVPSIYEGFGLPLLEAMKCECPILCSNATCLPEVAGDAAIYFNPKDKNEILNKIDELLSNNELRQELIKKGQKRLKTFNWLKAAEITLDLYKKI